MVWCGVMWMCEAPSDFCFVFTAQRECDWITTSDIDEMVWLNPKHVPSGRLVSFFLFLKNLFFWFLSRHVCPHKPNVFCRMICSKAKEKTLVD